MSISPAGTRERTREATALPDRHALLGRLVAATAVATGLAVLAPTAIGRALQIEAAPVQASTSPSVARVRVTIEALATPRTGATGLTRVEAYRTVAVGDRIATAAIVAGRASGAGLCDVATVSPGEAAEADVSWRVDGVVQAADETSVTVALTWQRAMRDPVTGASVVAIADERTVRLEPTDEHVLDVVEPPAATTSPCANTVLRIKAARAMPPAIARTWLSVDLWLTDEGSPGGQPARRLQLAAPEGDTVAFAFVPWRWGLDGTVATMPSRPEVRMAVSGTVRGTCRADGAVNVDLVTRRSVALETRGGSGGGRKTLVLVPGDTVAVEVPNPTMTVSTRAPEPALIAPQWAPGVQLSGDSVTVRLEEFFRGSRFLLLITAHCG